MVRLNSAEDHNNFVENINLRVADPSFDTPQTVKDKMSDALNRGLTHYHSTMGLEELRTEISKHYKKVFSIDLDPTEEIMVTNGAGEGLYLALNSLFTFGDEIIIPNPTYHGFLKKVLHSNIVPRFVPIYEQGTTKLNIGGINDAVSDRTRAIYICNPNNPTGTVMSQSEADALHEILQSNEHLLLILDKCYSRILYEGVEYVEMLKYADTRDQVIVVDSFSKTYAMTGWRIGFLIASKANMERIETLAFDVRSSVNTAVQDAAISALRIGNSVIAGMVKEYESRRNMLLEFLREHGLNFITPYGGFEVFVDIGKTGMDSERFTQELLRQVNVSVVPGTEFGPEGTGYVRIVFCAPASALKEGLDRIAHFLGKAIAD